MPWSFAELNWPGNRVWTRDIDTFGPNDVIRDVATRTFDNYDRVLEATLRPEIALLPRGAGGSSLLTRAGVFHTTRRRHALAYCPACMRGEPDVWLKEWRYAFSIVCPLHSVLLRDSCPACDAPLAPHRNEDPLTPRCDRCGCDLRSAEIVTFADSFAVRLQRLLVDELGRVFVDCRSPICEVADPPFINRKVDFRDVRALVAVSSVPWMRLKLMSRLASPFLTGTGRMRRFFETARFSFRHETMALVGRLMSNWPDTFLEVAHECGLTQCMFRSVDISPTLADALVQLPDRARSHTTKPPVVHDRALQRLRRRDPATYRDQRAQKLATLAGLMSAAEVAT